MITGLLAVLGFCVVWWELRRRLVAIAGQIELLKEAADEDVAPVTLDRNDRLALSYIRRRIAKSDYTLEEVERWVAEAGPEVWKLVAVAHLSGIARQEESA